MAKLKLNWCSYQAAQYAVKKWHYSRRMPTAKLVKIGVWEDDVFIGAVIYGSGATPEIGKPFGLPVSSVCELVRVALSKHKTETSKIVAISLNMLKKHFTGLQLVVSFADSSQGHHGGIYQAGGWVYVGSKEYHAYKVNNTIVHPKTMHSRYGKGGQSVEWLRNNVDRNAERIQNGVKHKYVYALNRKWRDKLAALSLPYPKRAKHPSDAPAVQAGEGGAAPTRTLRDA